MSTRTLSNVLLIILSFIAILIVTPKAGAQQEVPELRHCSITESLDSVLFCDVAVNKEVSINGGDFAATDSENDAELAQIGDSVVWRITITDLSSGGMQSNSTIVIEDILPLGTVYASHSASSGIYDQTSWTLTTGEIQNDSFLSNLPAVLTIETTAETEGVWKNSASISGFLCDGDFVCEGYVDGNIENNSNSAFINVVNPEIFQTSGVLGDSTEKKESDPQVLAETGNSNVFLALSTGLAIILLTFSVYRYSKIKIEK